MGVERRRHFFGEGRAYTQPVLLLTKDVKILGFSAEDCATLKEVFQPAESRASGLQGLIVVVREGVLVQLSLSSGAVIEQGNTHWPTPLGELARQQEVRWAIQIEEEAIAEVADRWARRLQPEHDALAQALELCTVLRELELSGKLSCWPRSLSGLPVPNALAVNTGLDLLCPRGQAVALGVFAEGKLLTALSARRASGGFDRIVGTELLRGPVGLLSGDFRRDSRFVVKAIEETQAPVGLGCFAELHTFQQLIHHAEPGAWARAVAARDVMLTPMSVGMWVPLGVDLGRVAWAGLQMLGRELGIRIDKEQAIGTTVERLQSFLGRDLEPLLGFDPWALLARLFRKD